MYCDIYVKAAVDDTLGVWLGIDGGYLTQNNIMGTSFPSYFVARKDWFELASGDRSNQFKTFTQTKEDNPGTLTYNFGSIGTLPENTDINMGNYDMHYVGQLTDFHWNEYDTQSGQIDEGYLWIAGSADYGTITDMIYPPAQKIYFTGLKKYLDYFPWAIKKSTGWESCNRENGSLTIRKNGTWRNCKNTMDSSGTNDTVHRRSGSSWTKCAKIGNNAR